MVVVEVAEEVVVVVEGDVVLGPVVVEVSRDVVVERDMVVVVLVVVVGEPLL